MKKYEFISQKNGKVGDIILKNYAFVSYNQLQKIFRQKDLLINGKRINKNVEIDVNDKVEFFCEETKIRYFETIFNDENIIVVSKRYGIIVASKDKTKPDELSLQEFVENEYNLQLLPYNRIDMNTSGLVVFVKDAKTLQLLQSSDIKKHYLAEVVGKFSLSSGKYQALLEKTENKIKIYKSKKEYELYNNDKIKSNIKNNNINNNKINKFNNKKTNNNENKNDDLFEIETEIKLLKINENNDPKKTTSLLEVVISKGKTHQIRAHLAYLGYAIIGDNKYGKKEINKIFSTKKQKLISYKIEFNTDVKKLKYLNAKEIQLSQEQIDMLLNK